MVWKRFGISVALVLVSLSSAAYGPHQNTAVDQIYLEDFESYNTDRQLSRAFTTWEDGADIRVTIEDTSTSSGRQAMRVDGFAPHPGTGNRNGSIYHVLARSERDWTDASGIQFWILNPEPENFSLSINFKEEYNEYWALGNSGVYYLLEPDGVLRQRELNYGNILIPPEFEGFVRIPFHGFEVPEWNTAHGDRILDLERIESYAFGFSADSEIQRWLSIDDIGIQSEINYERLELQGASQVSVPLSGEHREKYAALLGDLEFDDPLMVRVAWALADSPDPAIQIDNNGWLVVPAGAKGGNLILRARTTGSEPYLENSYEVFLDAETPAAEEASADAASLDEVSESVPGVSDTAYDEFSDTFETWAYENRPVFVLLSVGAILAVLFLLTLFQRKLK